MKRLAILFTALLLAAGPVAANEMSDARMNAAKRYVATMDIQWMMGESINQIALSVPEQHRPAFMKTMNELIDFELIETMTMKMMAEGFTVEELTALADFYEKPVGQSIMVKMPKMMGALMPIMQQQMMAAIQKMQQRAQERKNKATP